MATASAARHFATSILQNCLLFIKMQRCVFFKRAARGLLQINIDKLKSNNRKSEKAQVAANGRAAYGISYTETDLEHKKSEI